MVMISEDHYSASLTIKAIKTLAHFITAILLMLVLDRSHVVRW